MPEWFMGNSSGDGVSQRALGPAAVTPAILGAIGDTAFLQCPIGLKTVPNGFEAELVQTAGRGQVMGGEGSVGHVEGFRMSGMKTSIFGRPRPSLGQRRANPSYTLNCEERSSCLIPELRRSRSAMS